MPISLKLLIFLLSILIILSSLIKPETYAGLSFSTSFIIGDTKAFPIIEKIKANPIMPNIKFAKGPANTIENLWYTFLLLKAYLIKLSGIFFVDDEIMR